MSDSIWGKKGATMSDKSARVEFGLTQDEIVEAIRAEKLQYRVNNMHGNPYFKLVREEVEALVRDKHGGDHLEEKKRKHELARIDKELRRLKKETKLLETKKAELLARTGS